MTAIKSFRITDFSKTSKPWGSEILIDKNPAYAFKQIIMKAGSRSSLQSHRFKQETIFVVSGLIELEIVSSGGESQFEQFGPNQAYYLPAETIHRVRVIEDCLLYEVSTPELDDIIRYQDDFGRK